MPENIFIKIMMSIR